MFNLKKVNKTRKRLNLLTSFLFKLFQLNLRYKEKRSEYGLEIFEYFYLPWKVNEEFNTAYKKISEFTLNPKSRLYTIYEFSKHSLKDETSFIEVGTWKGGVCGLVSLTNKDKNIDIYACDTFEGVKNASSHDTYFKNGEYADAKFDDILNIQEIANYKFNVVKGVFPSSFLNIKLNKPISFAHIDVDTYISAKESFEYISENLIQGGVIILDDYGGWFTDGITKFGEELKKSKDYFAVPNHLGQLVIYKK